MPHVGWNKIKIIKGSGQNNALRNVRNNDFMYFSHSYFVSPTQEESKITSTEYCGINFCSGIRLKNMYGFQFHPEISGQSGIEIYKDFFNRRQISF